MRSTLLYPCVLNTTNGFYEFLPRNFVGESICGDDYHATIIKVHQIVTALVNLEVAYGNDPPAPAEFQLGDIAVPVDVDYFTSTKRVMLLRKPGHEMLSSTNVFPINPAAKTEAT